MAEQNSGLRFIARACNIILVPYTWLLLFVFGAPAIVVVLVLLLGIPALIVYGLYVGVVSLPTSAAIIIAAAINRRRG